MPYVPIENYGIIGDLHTVALVGTHGSIDWFCFPHFHSPSVFAALLDDTRGGHFQIAPVGNDVTSKQFYLPDTNILVTRFLSGDGAGEVCDLMPVAPVAEPQHPHRLIRRVSVIRGTMRFEVTCRPAFDYGRARHEVDLLPAAALFRSPGLALSLATEVPMRSSGVGVTSQFSLAQGQAATFLLEEARGEDTYGRPLMEAEYQEVFRATMSFWQDWVAGSTYRGRWREMVNRSALVLKLLTFAPTGTIVAAATTSLPGGTSGGRNWDYRYTWIRDASFTLYALLKIGFIEEAHRFMAWLEARAAEWSADGALPVVCDGEGHRVLTEELLDHLKGYRGLGPVRVGNEASEQFQLDVCGEVMDAAYLFDKHGMPTSYDLWIHLQRLADWVCDHWSEPDQGIWEFRSDRRHFTYSKVMCWVALDRALRLANRRSFPAPRRRWLETRDRIYEEVMTQGWDPVRRTFVQAYGSQALDASTLLMPVVFFLASTDPRMLSTLEAIQQELEADGLVHRYNLHRTADGLPGEEGSFCSCTFWLVEALTRARRLEEARWVFERMLGYANHVGLYAEQIGPRGEALGNFPQAFTHLSLITAAYNLDRALERRLPPERSDR